MSGKVALVTDSTADLPSALAEAKGIHIVPQIVIWEGTAYRDGVDLTNNEFYWRLGEASELPQTAPPSAEDFAAGFEAARRQAHADQVVALVISSKLSQSFVSAQAGARMVDFPVYLQDTQTVTVGLGFAALAAAAARDAGATVEGILAAARQARRQTSMYFTLDTLDFLYRGGRIGGARHLLGTALNLKPILTVTDGQVEAAENVRNRDRAVTRMLDLIEQSIPQGAGVQIAVINGHAEEEALELLTPVRRQFNPVNVIESNICAALGVHTGPGALGLAAWWGGE